MQTDGEEIKQVRLLADVLLAAKQAIPPFIAAIKRLEEEGYNEPFLAPKRNALVGLCKFFTLEEINRMTCGHVPKWLKIAIKNEN